MDKDKKTVEDNTTEESREVAKENLEYEIAAMNSTDPFSVLYQDNFADIPEEEDK